MLNTMYSDLADIFLALSDKTRLRLLYLMATGEVSVGYLADQLGESQPKVSRHLAYLRGAGLVSTRRDGKWIYYCIQAESDAVVDIINSVLRAMGSAKSVAVDAPVADAARGRWDNTSGPTDMIGRDANEMEVYLL